MVPVERSKAIEDMRMKVGKGTGQSKAEMLMARLVDRPENSHVLRMANSHTRRERDMPSVNGQGLQAKNTTNNSVPQEEKVLTDLLIVTCILSKIF